VAANGDGSSTSKDQPELLVSPSLVSTSASSATTIAAKPGLFDEQGVKVLWKRFLIDLSSLPRAIALMAATFGFSALGTFIPQNKAGSCLYPKLCVVHLSGAIDELW
jgi:hypothetical protein